MENMEEKNNASPETAENPVQENVQDDKEETIKAQKKKIKNLTAALILLIGLIIGSLFVDVSQLIKGSGFSENKLNSADIFQSEGKTWVAYTEPPVVVKVLSDDTCENCDPGEVLVWLRRVIPTISTQKVDISSDEGKALAKQFAIKTLPAFVFASNIEKTDFYTQAQPIFTKSDSQYVLNTQELGVPVGKYLVTPQVKEGDTTFGNSDSKTKVFVFSDFQCPYCALFHKSLRKVMNDYQDKVLFDFKHFPLSSIHPRANDAALAAECASDQNKFWEYGDMLFEKQKEWSATKDNAKFKQYALALRLNVNEFNQCLDSKKYQSKIDADRQEGEGLGLSGTPSIFIGDEFKSGVVNEADLKSSLENQLSQ
jgi:protein-disulfide isomerase